MNTEATDITLVLDRSGSMAAIRDDMEGALRTFVEDQVRLPGTCLLSALQFDSMAIEWIFQGVPVANVRPIAIHPRDSTPLFDALARAIRDTGQRLAALPEARRPGRVLVVVITDGQENSSRLTTAAQVRALVEQQRDVYKWEFVFFGANFDAIADAAAVGIPVAAGYVASKQGVAGLEKRMRYAASSFRSSGSAKEGLDRADAEDISDGTLESPQAVDPKRKRQTH